MIDELKPLLDKYKLDLRIEKKDNHLHLYVIPTLLDKDMSDEDKNVLERPLFKKYDLSERVDDGLANELLSYSNALIEGEDVISQIEKDIKAHAEKKKSSAKTPAKAATKPKRKTKAEEQAEAREKQAKEREGQSDLNLGGEDRLAAKEPDKVMPLKEKQIEEIESQSDAPLKEKQIEEMEGGLNLDLPSLEDL
jgi:uncharacterized protein YqfA (UPF0365 family)